MTNSPDIIRAVIEITEAPKRPNYPARMALFLTEKTGSCCGRHQGALPRATQLQLFGMVLTAAPITLDGSDETVEFPGGEAPYVFSWFEFDNL